MNANRMLMIATAIVAVAVLGLGWLFGMSPQLQIAERARADREVVATQNALQESTLVMLRSRSDNLDALAGDLTDLRAEIPATPDIESFLDALDDYAQGSGVTLATVTASEAVDYAGTVAPAAAADAGAPTEDATTDSAAAAPDAASGIYTVAVSLTVTGSVDQVIAFTRALQEGRRTFLATSVAFSKGTEGEAVAGASEEVAAETVPEETGAVAEGAEVAVPAAAGAAVPGTGAAGNASGTISGYLFVVRGADTPPAATAAVPAG